MGVLHHLDDPEQGLNILLDTLDTNGFLKLGLYSKSAREHVVQARKYIKKNKFDSNLTGIRNCRNLIKKIDDKEVLKKLNYNYDFYSTSSLRDLIFHVQEHHFTLPQISKLIKDFNLEFLGFTNSLLKEKYSNEYPEDITNTSLDKWHQFENRNPDAFIGMYQFWVRGNIK